MNGVGRVPTVLQCSEAHVELKSSTLSKVSRMNQGALEMSLRKVSLMKFLKLLVVMYTGLGRGFLSCRVANIISSWSLIECGITRVSFTKFAFLVIITSIMDLKS